MCTYHTLYQNEANGYAIKCLQCNNIQLAFGNACITFPVADFPSFFTEIKKFAENLSHTVAVHAKIIYIPTPCTDVKLLLSHAQLNALVNMLDVTDTELKSLHLLSFFKRLDW